MGVPPHEVYIEPFLGGGAIMRQKFPALLNIGLDLDAAVIARFNDEAADIALSGDARSHLQFHQGDGAAFLRSYPFTRNELVYCDPPYMHETRGRTDLYRFEMDDRQHAALLDTIKALPCRVMISGYWTKLYAAALQAQRSMSIRAGGDPSRRRIFQALFRQLSTKCILLSKVGPPCPRGVFTSPVRYVNPGAPARGCHHPACGK
jgi:DNA adenine methylase